MVGWASLWSWPFGRAEGEGDMSISKALDKLGPVLGMGGFTDPCLEGAEVINRHFRYVSKEQSKVLGNVVFVVQEGTTNMTGVVTSCGQHALCWPVMGARHYFSNEIHLSSCNHIAYSRLQYPLPLCKLKWAVTHMIGLHVELTILGEYDVASMTIVGRYSNIYIVFTVDTRAH